MPPPFPENEGEVRALSRRRVSNTSERISSEEREITHKLSPQLQRINGYNEPASFRGRETPPSQILFSPICTIYMEMLVYRGILTILCRLIIIDCCYETEIGEIETKLISALPFFLFYSRKGRKNF